ncbi:MAG: LPS assembly lipoprotein LptE [Pseudohongiellaceae bacterium]
MPVSIYRFLFAMVSVMTLTACGFTLRGTGANPASLPNLQLDLQQENGEIARLIRRSLVSSHESPGDATARLSESPVLSISAEQLDTRPVSINPRARAAQYELRMAIDISLTSGETFLIEPETLLIERVYFEDTENITGNLEEVETIKAEMRRELVDQLVRRLQAVDSLATATPATTAGVLSR